MGTQDSFYCFTLMNLTTTENIELQIDETDSSSTCSNFQVGLSRLADLSTTVRIVPFAGSYFKVGTIAQCSVKDGRRSESIKYVHTVT